MLYLWIVVIDYLLEGIIFFHRFLPVSYLILKQALDSHTVVTQMLAICNDAFCAEKYLVLTMRTLVILAIEKLDSTSATVAVLFIPGRPPIHGCELESLDHAFLVTLFVIYYYNL
jgi:hypothetical protein